MTPTNVAFAFLAAAIVCEVIGTTTLKATDGFTKWLPTVLVLVSYSTAFFCMSQTLKVIPVGITYAIWCAGGIVLLAVMGWLVYRETLDLPAIIGIGLVLAGVVVIALFSKTIQH